MSQLIPGQVVGYVVMTLTNGKWCDDWDGEVHPTYEAALASAVEAAPEHTIITECRYVATAPIDPPWTGQNWGPSTDRQWPERTP